MRRSQFGFLPDGVAVERPGCNYHVRENFFTILGQSIVVCMYINTHSTRNLSVAPKPRYETDVRRRHADLVLLS